MTRNLAKLFTLHLSLFTAVAALAAATQPVELMPFTFAGRIVDYAHVAFDADTCVEIRVKAQDGTLLAKTTTATKGGTAYNYAVDVPLASKASARHTLVGAEVVFEFVDAGGKAYLGLVPANNAVIGNPGESKRVDVILASDADNDGVADEYVETLDYMMWLNGVEEYDAQADYDGDGQSNYAEYVAGTNPFDATDAFSIREMADAKNAGDYVAFRVKVEEGRTYTMSAASRIGADASDWSKTGFSVSDPSAALQSRLTTAVGEMGYRTIYVKKDGSQRFLRMDVE